MQKQPACPIFYKTGGLAIFGQFLKRSRRMVSASGHDAEVGGHGKVCICASADIVDAEQVRGEPGRQVSL